MQKAYNGGKDANATIIGWQIGRLVANERLTSKTTDGVSGATYLIDVLLCMSDITAPQTNGVYPSLPIPQKFLANAPAVLSAGIWEIRGGSINSGKPAAGHVKLTTGRALGLPRWGVEAVNATWPGTKQYAVFAYPFNVGTFGLPSASYINTNTADSTNAFELGTIPNIPNPDVTDHSALRVGVCEHFDVSTGTANRLIHDPLNTESNRAIIDKSTLTQLCSADTSVGPVALAPTPTTWYATFMRRTADLLAPANAYADDGISDCTDCIGGLPSGWSPFATGILSASGIVLTITQQPGNTTISQTTSMIVQATVNGFTVPGIHIDSVSVANNSGTPAGATVDYFATTPSSTRQDGTITITFSVGKAGGYLVTVWANLDGAQVPTVTSTLFNVKNQ